MNDSKPNTMKEQATDQMPKPEVPEAGSVSLSRWLASAQVEPQRICVDSYGSLFAMADPDQRTGWSSDNVRIKCDTIKEVCEKYNLIVLGHYDNGIEYYRVKMRAG